MGIAASQQSASCHCSELVKWKQKAMKFLNTLCLISVSMGVLPRRKTVSASRLEHFEEGL